MLDPALHLKAHVDLRIEKARVADAKVRHFGEVRTGSRTYRSHSYNSCPVHHAIRRRDIVGEPEDKSKGSADPNKQRCQGSDRNVKEYEDGDPIRRG